MPPKRKSSVAAEDQSGENGNAKAEAKTKSKDKVKKGKKDFDWAAPEHFDKNRSMIYIEYTSECPIFSIKADEFHKYLVQNIPERIFQLIRNRNGKVKPRPGAFEIDFSQNARTSLHNLWSGIDKGPPRRDKFPSSYDLLLPEVQKILKKFYPDVKTKIELNDDREDDDDDE